MKADPKPLIIATRGSALALAQANAILNQCRQVFSEADFEIEIFKTTGDGLQNAATGDLPQNLPKGLFTKELESALLDNRADLAVHSLKDLPTELPQGLTLGAVGQREDVREVVIFKDRHLSGESDESDKSDRPLSSLAPNATMATSSPRRQSQLLTLRPDLKIVDIRGNVPTRIKKLHARPEVDAIILAAAGLHRLGYRVSDSGLLEGDEIPPGTKAEYLPTESMLPCVGQGAIGIEIRSQDALLERVCAKLNHLGTACCVRAERAFLRAMGGGCQSPVAALAVNEGDQLTMRAVSFQDGPVQGAEAKGATDDPESLGKSVAIMVHG